MALEISRYYDELGKLDIELEFHENPSPTYIQKKTVECNEKLRKSQKLYLEIERALTVAQRALYIESSQYNDQKKRVLTENEKIKKFPTIKEREAAVEEMFSDTLKRIAEFENDVMELERVENTIKSHQKFLRDVNANIKTQQRTMDVQLMRLNIVPRDHPDVVDLTEAMDAVDAMEKDMDSEVESSEETVELDKNITELSDDVVVEEKGGQNNPTEVPSPTSEVIDDDIIVMMDDGEVEEKGGQTSPTEVPSSSEKTEESIGVVEETPVSKSIQGDVDVSDLLEGLDEPDPDKESDPDSLANSVAFDPDSTTLGEAVVTDSVENSEEGVVVTEDSASISESGIDIDGLLESL